MAKIPYDLRERLQWAKTEDDDIEWRAALRAALEAVETQY